MDEAIQARRCRVLGSSVLSFLQCLLSAPLGRVPVLGTGPGASPRHTPRLVAWGHRRGTARPRFDGERLLTLKIFSPKPFLKHHAGLSRGELPQMPAVPNATNLRVPRGSVPATPEPHRAWTQTLVPLPCKSVGRGRAGCLQHAGNFLVPGPMM